MYSDPFNRGKITRILLLYILLSNLLYWFTFVPVKFIIEYNHLINENVAMITFSFLTWLSFIIFLSFLSTFILYKYLVKKYSDDMEYTWTVINEKYTKMTIIITIILSFLMIFNCYHWFL